MAENITDLRVLSGELKGKKILVPKDKKTHPMGARERLALFNSIGPDIKNAIILDAFAGTGAVGIEAISRGATHVTFIEKNHKVAELLRKNLKDLKLEDKTRVFEADVETMNFNTKFDYVLADPPYDKIDKVSRETFRRLANLARKNFILSHPASFDSHFVDAKLVSTKSYAGARISTFTSD